MLDSAHESAGLGFGSRQPVLQRAPADFEMPKQSPTLRMLGDTQRQGSKTLTYGTMAWSLVMTPNELVTTDDDSDYRGEPSAIMQIVFTPKAAGRTVTFVQTVSTARLDTGGRGKAKVDTLPGDLDPFYGPQWDPKALDWIPEMAVPEHRASQSSTASDPSAYLYDEPSAPPGTAKMFESVAIDPRTGALLGALSWGVGGRRLLGADDVSCTDRPTGDFGVALDAFYATPTSGQPSGSGPRFETILDEFRGDDATLSDDHRSELNRAAATIKAQLKDRKIRVLVTGHGDAMDRDPMDASNRRARAVVDYLVGAAVPATVINQTGFGDKWARAPVSMKEGRNRRVQIKLRDPT